MGPLIDRPNVERVNVAGVVRRRSGLKWGHAGKGRRAAGIAQGAAGECFLSAEASVFLSADDGSSWNELTIECLDGRSDHASDIAVVAMRNDSSW